MENARSAVENGRIPRCSRADGSCVGGADGMLYKVMRMSREGNARLLGSKSVGPICGEYCYKHRAVWDGMTFKDKRMPVYCSTPV
jgi:hypothetical protein